MSEQDRLKFWQKAAVLGWITASIMAISHHLPSRSDGGNCHFGSTAWITTEDWCREHGGTFRPLVDETTRR